MNASELPWPVRPFAEVADYHVGKTPARANDDYWDQSGEVVPWVAISDLTPYGTVITTKEPTSKLAFDQVFRGELVPAGTLLMSFKLTIGRVATLGIPAVHNEAIVSIYPREGIDQRFLGYYLSQYDYAGLQDRQIKGNTLNKEKIDRIPVPTPPEPEQRAIGAVLDEVRESLTRQSKLLATLEELKQAFMVHAFTYGMRNEEQKDTEIGPVPASWTVGPVGDMAEFQRGFDITKSEQVVTGAVPVVSSGGVKSFHNVAASPGPGVVIGRKGSIGSVHYVETDYWPHDTTLWCKNFRGNLPKFVFYRMQVLDMKRLDSGATNPALNRNFLHAEVISWPGIDEQSEVVEILDAVDQKIDLHQRRLHVLDDLFKSLLQKLMTGEISIADLELGSEVCLEGSAP